MVLKIILSDLLNLPIQWVYNLIQYIDSVLTNAINLRFYLWACPASGTAELVTAGFPGMNSVGLISGFKTILFHLQLHYSFAEYLHPWNMHVEGHAPVLRHPLSP